MKKIRKKIAERKNVRRSRLQGTDKAFLERIIEERISDLYEAFFERLIEERISDLYEAFLGSLDKRVYALLDRLDDLEDMQMDLVKIQSAMTKRLFPDYVPAPPREKVQKVRGYHENFLN